MPEINNIQTQDADMARLREFQRSRQKQPVPHNGKTPLVRKSGYDALDKNSFLKLLVTQLSKQDPTNPMNDREFISQMAQFSSLEQMNNVANSMNKLRASQASNLIGKMIEGKDFVTEKHLQGIVTSAIYEPNGDVLLKVGGRFTKFDDVTSVTEVARTPNVSRETFPPIQTQINAAQASKAYEANQVVAPQPVKQAQKGEPTNAGEAQKNTQPSRIAVEAKVPSAVEAKVPSAVEAKVPSAVEAKVPSAVEAKVPSAVEAKVPSAVEAKVPSAVEAKVPSAVEAKAINKQTTPKGE